MARLSGGCRELTAVLLCLVGDASLQGVRAGDAALGEHLSGECVTCHLRSGRADGIPAIVGWPQDQFVAVLDAYRTGERDHAVMRTIAGRLNREEVAALAAYFASAATIRAQ